MADQPKAKRFKHVARLLEEKQKEPTDEDSSVPVEKAELNEYLKKPISLEEDEDPFKFWTTNTAYASLAPAAKEILVVPASSAPVERIFSTGGEATTGRRNRLTNWNLEREVFLRQNKSYIPEVPHL